MKKLMTLFAVLSFLSMTAQIETGAIKGKVTDDAGEPVPFANITAFQSGNQILGATSDFDGNYTLKPLQAGMYEVQFSFVGYSTNKIKEVEVFAGKITSLNAKLHQGTNLETVEIQYSKPIFQRDRVISGSRASRRNNRKIAEYSPSDIAKTSGSGVYSRDNGNKETRVRGGRSKNSVTFIDGVKVIGSTNLPGTYIEEVRVKTSGVPAQYSNEEEYKKRSVGNPEPSRITIHKPEKRVENDAYLYTEENYENIADNEFESVTSTPLSTFSVDVDRASYANMRRYINDGYFPPQSAVRIEELINYFDYKYPEPEGDHPISITTELADCPWNKDRKLAMIGIQGKNINMSEAVASNLVFLIDVSGSMSSEDKLGLLKSGLKMLTAQLREEDKIAIVVYAGAAGVVLESTKGSEKIKIKSVLSKLTAGGSTAGGEGIELAYKIAEKNFIKGGNNRIILATDGDFNVGISDQTSLVKLIEKKRENGVFLSILGFGTGNLNDAMMEQVADHGNGNYNYIDNLLEAKKVLVSEMGGTLFTIAKDVKVQAEFNPAVVKSYRLVGYVNRLLADEDFNDDLKDAGEMGAGHTVTVLYEIIPVGSAEKMNEVDELKYKKAEEKVDVPEQYANELMTVKFRYKKPDGKKSVLMTEVLKNETVSLVRASENLRFSAAVASFGMKLRGSASAQNLSYRDVLKMAKEAQGEDEEGYRAEFIKLVKTADLMD